MRYLRLFESFKNIYMKSVKKYSNNIKTFEYFPNYVKGNFTCYNNLIYGVWRLFDDTSKIELLNDFDIFRDEDTDEPTIIMDRLNDFLLTIGEKSVRKVNFYKNL